MAATGEQPDAELLAGLRRPPRSSWRGLLAGVWAVGAVLQLVQDHVVLGLLWALAALCWAWTWWVGPTPALRAVTDDALLVQFGVRARSIARSDVEDVQPRYSADNGVVLVRRDAGPVQLAGTALGSSVARAQAAALRRWAGLE